MNNKLLVVADLGCLKAYRVSDDKSSSSPRLELIEVFNNPDAHGKLIDKVTDGGGRFEGGNSRLAGGHGNGERHNINLELAKRAIREMAKKISVLIKGEKDSAACYFAASKEINRPILEHLDRDARARIVANLPENLIHTHKSELLGHFAHAGVAV